MIRATGLAAVKRMTAHTRVESEAWFWLREALTFAPGQLGMAVRAAFYNHYFAAGSDQVIIMAGAYIEHPQHISLAGRATFGRNCWVSGEGGLTLGADVGIGPGAVIHTASHRTADRDRPFLDQGHDLRAVSISDDVWVAANVVITPGSQIGRGAILLPGAVISGSVAPFAIMGGSPARAFGSRGQESVADLEQRWRDRLTPPAVDNETQRG
jgi:acetyltransferase-like isoleucine patch superfamily enzyme